MFPKCFCTKILTHPGHFNFGFRVKTSAGRADYGKEPKGRPKVRAARPRDGVSHQGFGQQGPNYSESVAASDELSKGKFLVRWRVTGDE